MSNDRFQTAAVIGTGMMGPGIAAILALGGVRSTILSRSEETAAKGVEAARQPAHDRLVGLAVGAQSCDCRIEISVGLRATIVVKRMYERYRRMNPLEAEALERL